MDHDKARAILEQTVIRQKNFSPRSLSPEFQEMIEKIILGNHLTFRYMLLTALLAKVIDPSIHMRAVQAQSNLNKSYDARSLCHKVIVPFDKEILCGRLGDSNEPFLNKPARCVSIEKDNPVRKGPDKDLLVCLYDLLEGLNASGKLAVSEALNWAMKKIMERPVRDSDAIVLPKLTISSYGFFERISAFVSKSYEGEAPVAVAGAIFMRFYPDAKTEIHPANEAGSSSNEVGDIDIKFPDGRLYAVEVKDKIFSTTDINHAVEKARASHCNKAIFALGYNASSQDVDFYSIMQKWNDIGINLSFVAIPQLLEQYAAMQGNTEYDDFIQCVMKNLYAMRAKDIAVNDFNALWH